MSTDLLLGVLTAIMGLTGFLVSIHAPQRKWKIFAACIFFVLTGCTIILVIKQSRESATTASKLERSLEALQQGNSEIARVQSLNTELQQELIGASAGIKDLASRNLSISGRMSGKSDEIASLSHRLLAKDEEIVSLHKQLAAKSEENSNTRKRDLETREVTIEQLIRTAASECVTNNPELQKKLDSIHSDFERSLTESLNLNDSLSTDSTSKKVPEPPKR